MKNNKLFRILGIAVVFIMMLFIAACGKQGNPLCHTWVNDTEKYTFRADGSGVNEWDGEKTPIRWKTYDNIIEIVTGTSVMDDDFDIITYYYSLQNNGKELLLDDEVYTRAK